MEDKKTALAIVLSIAVVMVYTQVVLEPYNRQLARQRAEQQAAAASSAPSANQSTSSISPHSAAPGASTAAPGSIQPASTESVTTPAATEVAAAKKTVVTTELFEVAISHLGGRIVSLALDGYQAHLGQPARLDLVTAKESSPYPLGVYVGALNDARVNYELTSVSPGAQQSGDSIRIQGTEVSEISLVFTGTLPNGVGITKTILFTPRSYLFKVNVALAAPLSDRSRAWLEWSHFTTAEEAQVREDPLHFTVLTASNKILQVLETSVPSALQDSGAAKWISYGSKYFMTTIVNGADLASDIRYGRDNQTHLMRMGGGETGGSYFVFAGPKHHKMLEATGHQLERNVDLGWFSFLAHPLLWLLIQFHGLLGNWGLAIVLLTLVIKIVFLPLTRASFVSMKAMQDLQPEIQALRERVKDPNELNQEMMQLYKRRGVNPLGGCLPMLIQLPVFLGLYNALFNAIELRHAPFALWINDLSTPERLEVAGIGIPVMILVMGLSMFIQQRTSPQPADPQQQKIMMMMPIIFTVMFVIFPFPAGLVLYWLVNNLTSIIQQVYLRKGEGASHWQATILGSVLIFAFAYLLTLISKSGA